MSEEILKALTQLFAIISKQDGGVTEGERDFVISFFKKELDAKTVEEYLTLYDKASDYGVKEVVLAEGDGGKQKTKKKLTNVKDSVRTLGLCRKINKTLNQKQKVVASGSDQWSKKVRTRNAAASWGVEQTKLGSPRGAKRFLHGDVKQS